MTNGAREERAGGQEQVSDEWSAGNAELYFFDAVLISMPTWFPLPRLSYQLTLLC